MKVRCVYNSGDELLKYNKNQKKYNELGRFGSTKYTEFGITLNKEYIVMGMILGKSALEYLIDDDGIISSYPYPLFEVIDNKIPSNWFFKSYNYFDKKYPYIEAIWGYYELVFDDNHYSSLIEGNRAAERIYFKRKIEIEKMYNKN